MAIVKSTRYPGRWETASSEYPMGKPKNRTSKTSEDGTYPEADWLSDYEAFFGAIMTNASYTPNGTVDTAISSQLFNALRSIQPVENRLKGHQNWNISGSTGDSLPGTVAISYTSGAEIAAGCFASGSLVNATYENGIFDADSGSYYIEYSGDFTSDFYGLKLEDGTISQTGCTISLNNGNTRLLVDMSVAPAHKFAGLSEYNGVWPDIGDEDESIYNLAMKSRQWTDVSSQRAIDDTYTNDTHCDIELSVSLAATSASDPVALNIAIDNSTVARQIGQGSSSGARSGIVVTIPKGSTYSIDTGTTSPTIDLWKELRV